MNSGFIKSAAISPRVYVGDVAKNCDEIIKMLRKSASENIQIAVFPELALCGATCSDLFFQETLISACLTGLEKIKNYSVHFDGIIAVGAPVKHMGRLYSCAVVMQNGKILGIVPKTNLTVTDRRWFSSFEKGADNIKLFGEYVPFGKLTFVINDETTIGVEIGNDLYALSSPATELAANGANVILSLGAEYETVTKNDYRLSLIKAFSAKAHCGYIYASAGTGESSTDFVYSGACTVAENGKLLAEGERFAPNDNMTVADIDIDAINSERLHSDSFSYNEITSIVCEKINYISTDKLTRKFDSHPFIPSDNAELQKRCREILNIQTSGLGKRMRHIGIKKLILGISGGLDSTLALLVSVKTVKQLGLPADNVICVTMPGFGTTDLTYTNACNLVKSLGAQLVEIDIKKACLQHMEDIGHDSTVHDITYENTQARERTQILMDLANKHGALLVGTGDLSELALGWCTYNGDHMSMYGVNASVPKTMMRHIVKSIADNSNKNTAEILYSVLATPVSPELLPPDENGKTGQKTENLLGPYDVHDFYLYHFIRFGTRPEKLLFMAERAFENEYSREELKGWLTIFIKRFFQSQFKRSCMADGPKVGSVSLSPRGDFVMPSDALYSEWLKF